MDAWATQLSAVTLFVRDLDASTAFYKETFDLPVHFADEESIVFAFGSVLVNLLVDTAVPELIAPATAAPPEAGARLQMTVPVDDVDAVTATLRAAGVTLLTDPTDRPWGVRTASFVDLDGHVWEIAAPLPR